MKRFSRRTLCFILIVLVMPLLSLTAWAQENSAELHSLHFDVALQEDGSAQITETREIVFSGDRTFTRYGVNSVFAGPRAFSDWQVSLDGTPLARLDEPDHENRPENTFAVEDGDGENTVYVYFRQQGSGTRVFRISYRVEYAVKLYDDVGEFFWNLTGETGVSDIGTLTATLTVPGGIPAEGYYIWAHGPLNGDFDKQPDGSAALRVDNVPLGTIIDIRCAMPADCFTGGWVQQGEALSGILAEEKALADSANARREEEVRAQAERDAYWEAYWAERNAWAAEHPVLDSLQNFCEWLYDFFRFHVAGRPVGVVILGAGVFGITAFVGRLLRKPQRYRHAPAQSPQYCRDLPDDRPAPAVDRLVHFYDGKPDVSRQISAALLELNLKGLVDFRSIDGEVTLVLNAQPGEELFPSSAPQETGAQGLSPAAGYQEALWRFLLNAADGCGQIAMKDLRQYVLDNQEAAWLFHGSFESAVSAAYGERVKTEVVKRSFFGETRLALLLPALAGALAILVRTCSMLYDGVVPGVSLSAGMTAFAVTALMIVFCCLGRWFAQGRCEILDQQAEDDLALWQAFGRYLDDFTTVGEKELPEFSAWRTYMPYAVAMGCGQTAAGALALGYPEALFDHSEPYDDELYRMMRDMEFYRAMDSMGREVAAARQPVSAESGSDSSWSDNWSDSCGDGGGFSDSGGGSDSGSGGDFID